MSKGVLAIAENSFSVFHFDWSIRVPYASIFDTTITLSVSELVAPLLVPFYVAGPEE